MLAVFYCNVYIYIYIYIYVCVCVCIYIYSIVIHDFYRLPVNSLAFRLILVLFFVLINITDTYVTMLSIKSH